MERMHVGDISSRLHNKKVLLKGWVHDLRDLAKIKFLLLRDSTGIVQCIVKDKKLFRSFSELSPESAIEMVGRAKKARVESEEVSNHSTEIDIESIKMLGKAESLPVQVMEKGIETVLSKRLDYRFLDLRRKEIKAIFSIQSEAVNAFREFFFKSGFMEIQPPGIIATATEGGTDLFKIRYFEMDAYLAQSPQLYKQLAAMSLERVFSTSTVWRAEKHNTTQHLNEVRQLDIEVAFADEFVVMKHLEGVIKHVFSKVRERCKKELEMLNVDLRVPKAKYMTYKEAVGILNKKGVKIKHGDDFDREAEGKLCDIFPHTVLFIHDWPKSLKPFYIWPKGDVTGGFDAIYGGIEISSGGQRVHVPDVLIKQLKERGLNPDSFKWYIDAFRYGAPEHAGWSIGLERLTMALCNLDNIREACLFPRDRERITP
jgi:aspartyl-tRNA synthetase